MAKRKPKTNRGGNIYEAKGIDACQTPPYAVAPLLPYLQRYSQLWEPAAGEGYLAAALEKAGHVVVKTDILTGQNFFFTQPPYRIPIITNPPYSVKVEWLARCYELELPFALLLPVDTIALGEAQALFEQHGIEIIWLNRRVNFKMPQRGWGGRAQFSTAWFTNNLGVGRENTFAKIYYPSATPDQLPLFEGV